MPQEWGTQVHGVDTRLAVSDAVALTFDACGPGPNDVDLALFDLLRRERLRATLFLNMRWIDAHADLVKSLAADPLFDVESHGTLHKPLSVNGRSAYGIAGCASLDEARNEVAQNQVRMQELTGRAPRYFRSGTAYYDEVGAAVVRDLGLTPVSFTTNGDGGAKYPVTTVTQEILKAPAGAIVLMHLNHGGGPTAAGLAGALPGLRSRGLRFVTLSEVGTAP